MAKDRAKHATVVDTVLSGFHVYKDVWNPVIGETLFCTPEFGNIHDPYAVAACKGVEIVGHTLLADAIAAEGT